MFIQFNLGSNKPSIVEMVAKYYNTGRSGSDRLMFLNCKGYVKDTQTDCRTYSANGKLTHANRYDIRTEISRYYSIFLNAMATIINNFGAKIIKNAGDALIYYFPKASDINNKVAFKDVLECGITMMAAHPSINSKMRSERLPSVNYRISADYGEMQLARSISSQSEDLFGTAINVCAKINSKAPANKMIIGDGLYHIDNRHYYGDKWWKIRCNCRSGLTIKLQRLKAVT